MKQFKQQDLINNFGTQYASLVRATVKQFGGCERFKEQAEDVANYGISAGFSGFIYHSDTVAFVKRHKTMIMDYARDDALSIGYESVVAMLKDFNCLNGYSTFEIEDGLYNSRSDDQTAIYNALAWYIGECVARCYVDCI